MGIIQVAGPQTGKSYNVNIAGQTPTPEEQYKIDNFVKSQEESALRYLRQYGVGAEPQSTVQPPQQIDKTAFGRGLDRMGLTGTGAQYQSDLGNTMEALGEEFGWEGIEKRGKEKKEIADKELARLQAEDPSVRFEDIRGVGTAGSVVGEALGEEFGDLAIQSAATAGGAAVGSLFFGAGALPGAAIGRTLGVGYTTIKSLPQLFSENIEAQRRAGDELNLRAAAGTTLAQAAAEFVADYLIVGKLLPSKGKNRVVRALSGGGEAFAIEGTTELLQQMGTRAQAGLPMFNEEAMLEYAEAFSIGGAVGFSYGTGLGALSPKDKTSDKELDDDIAEDIKINNERFEFAEQADAEVGEIQRSNAEVIETRGLPSPEKPVGLLPSPTTVSPLEFDQKSYDKSVFDRVLQQITADKAVNITSIFAKAKKDIPTLKRKQVLDVIEDLKTRGIVADNPSTKGGKYILMGEIAPTLDNLDVRLRRTIDTATANIKTLEKKLGILNNITRPTVLRTGFDLKGKKTTARDIEAEIAATEEKLNIQNKMIEVAQKRLGQQHVPSIERVGIPNNLKQVPIGEMDENTPSLVRKYEAQKRLLEDYRSQAAGIKKALGRLNRIAKKRNLNSNEAEKFTRLQTAYAEASQRAAEIQSNLKTPKQVVASIKAEQEQEARDLRELELRVKAAEAKSLDATVQETQYARQEADSALGKPRVDNFTSSFNEKQSNVFAKLRKRLSGYNLKDIKLEGEQKLEGAEGSYNPMSRVIALAMGMYNPNMTEDQLFDSIAEVMDHEMIHALKDIGVMTDKEFSILAKAAKNTKYVKRNADGTSQTRSYTYLDRAERYYPEASDQVQQEEAIAEMFRDFNAGRLKSSGAARGIYNKVKNFFKNLISVFTGSGFNSVESIFKTIQSGEMGARERPTQKSSNELNEVKQPKQSRLVMELTDEQRNASILPYINPNTGQPLFKSKPGSNTLISFSQKLRENRTTREYDIINSEQDREEVARIMAAEAEAALISSPDALGWYDKTLKLAKKILYSQYPEISPERPDGTPNPQYDPEAEFAFDYATAVTSNGMAVVENYRFAASKYDEFVKTGKFKVQGTGNVQASMQPAFEFWNSLVDSGRTVSEINEILMEQVRRGDLNNRLTEIYGVERVKDLPIEADAKEEADTIVSVAYVIGPKIGNGFLQNLRGNFDPLTMDRWWMRFVNRITGKPFVEFSDSLIEKNRDRLWDSISNYKDFNDIEKGMLEDAIAELNVVNLEKTDLDALAPVLMKQWNKRYNKAYNDKLKSLVDEMDFVIQGSKIVGKDAEAAKEISRNARPVKPELALASSALAEKLAPKMQEDPRGGPDRTAMRTVANRARELLRQNNQIAADLTNADFQALMWYAEKRIFEAGGVRKGQGDDNDYADGAIALLQKKGVPNDAIKNSLPDSERRRVDSQQTQLEGDTGTSDIPIEAVRGPKEGDFFSAREVEILSDEEFVDVEPDEKGIKGVPSPVRLSAVPTEDQRYQPVFSPVKNEKGNFGIAYGKIMFRGELRSVFLPMGSHTVYESGLEVGNGLYHIQQRLHDKELVENSKYKRVENAIFDILRRWKDQGYDDGESVISYQSGEGTVLEWRENLGFSSPPLKLVLEYGEDVTRPSPLLVKKAFYVHTFYPLLEKKKRSAPQKTGVAVRNQARADVPKMLSKLMSDTPLSRATPNFGPTDFEQTMQNLRYAATQNAIASGLGKLGKPFKIDQEKIEAGTNWFFDKMQDEFLAVGQMYDKLRAKGANIARDMDAYFQELLMHGVQGPKKEKFQETELTPILELVAGINLNRSQDQEISQITTYFNSMKDRTGNSGHALANTYLYALHAKERNKRISELSKGKVKDGSGMSDIEADNIINFVQSLDQTKRSSLEQIAQRTRDIIKGTNEVYIEGGLIPDYMNDQDIDDATREAFNKYENYVPLRGFADEEVDLDLAMNQESMTKPSSDRFGTVGSPNRSPVGRSSLAGDIISNIAVQRQAAIDKAEKNKVGRAFLKLLQDETIDTTDFADVRSTHPLRRVMRNGVITTAPDRNFHSNDLNILPVRQDGQEFLIQFYDPRIAAAFKGQSTRQTNKFLGALHSMVRVYANMLTSWNPAFILGNAPRDIETALYNSQQYNMKGSSADIMKGVAPAFWAIANMSVKKDGGDPYWRKRYQEFYDNGGQNVLNQMSSDIDNQKDIKKTVQRIVEADGKGNKGLVKTLMTGTKKGGASLFGYVEAANSAAENGVRLAFFDSVVKNLESQGVPKERALREGAAAARQLTTNFAKGGQNKNFWNSFYLFYNASFQGSMAMINATANSPKARVILGGIVLSGFLMDQLVAFTSGDEDEDGIPDYDKMNDYKLAHSIVLPDFFDMSTDGQFITIPMAYGLNIFYNAGRSMSAMLRGKETVGQAVSSTVGTLVGTLNPFGGNSPLTFVAPTVIDPVVELLTNKNFMDGPIYKELSPFEQYKSRSALHWETTSPTAVSIAKFVNDTIGGGTDIIPGEVLGQRVDMNPDTIEHIMDFLLGGAGKFGIQLFEFGTNGVPAIIDGEWERAMVRRTPFLNKVYTATTEKDRAGDFYEKRDDILAIDAELRDARSSGDKDRASAVISRYPELIRLIKPIKGINSRLRKLNKRKRLIIKNANLSEDVKRQKLDKIAEAKSKLIARANILMKDI